MLKQSSVGRKGILPTFFRHQLLLGFALLILSGCGITQQKVNSLSQTLKTDTPENLLVKFQAMKPDANDQVLFDLNVGMLQFLSQDYDEAIKTLTYAKNEMAALYATSVTENIGAATINETMRSYSGTPTDLVMVHNILALSYLFRDDLQGARVEMLQADIMMKKLVKSDSNIGQLASTHVISAIVYELSGEIDNAFISYKFAAEIMQSHGIALPRGVKLALTRMSKNLGQLDQYDKYVAEFNMDEEALNSYLASNMSNVFVLYFDDLVIHKRQRSIMANHESYDNDNDRIIRVSVPAYPPGNRSYSHAQLSAGEEVTSTEQVENVDKLAKEDLSADYPAILLAATTRAIFKDNMVKNSEKKESAAGALMNIVTVLTEVADLRSWSTLPASIDYAYLSTEQPLLTINAPGNQPRTIELTTGSKHVIMVTSLTDKLFHYQSMDSRPSPIPLQ